MIRLMMSPDSSMKNWRNLSSAGCLLNASRRGSLPHESAVVDRAAKLLARAEVEADHVLGIVLVFVAK